MSLYDMIYVLRSTMVFDLSQMPVSGLGNGQLGYRYYRDLYLVEYNMLLSVGRSRCFRVTSSSHLQGLRISQTRNQHETGNKQSFAAIWFLAWLIFLP
jgi:hypothetical protein